MRRIAPWIPAVIAGALALGSFVLLAVASRSHADARDAVARAERLYEARLAVADAQEALGAGDIGAAVDSAGDANETALRVGRLTTRMVELLRPTSERARASISSSQRGAANAAVARRQTEVAAEALAAIASYQEMASSHSAASNAALRRILQALRETNRRFPGRPPP